MSVGADLLGQFQLAPAELPRGLQIPQPFIVCGAAFQDDHVLRPANLHGRAHQSGAIFIGAVKIAHAAQVAGRKAGGFGIGGLQMFRGGHRRALFRAGADQRANLTVQLHLRQALPHQFVQGSEHGAVIYRLADVHGSLLSGAECAKCKRPPALLPAVVSFQFYIITL